MSFREIAVTIDGQEIMTLEFNPFGEIDIGDRVIYLGEEYRVKQWKWSGKKQTLYLEKIGGQSNSDDVHLEAARVKIAKARFSGERLVSERDAYGNDCPGGRCE